MVASITAKLFKNQIRLMIKFYYFPRKNQTYEDFGQPLYQQWVSIVDTAVGSAARVSSKQSCLVHRSSHCSEMF